MTGPDLLLTGGRDVHQVHFPLGTPPGDVDVLVVGAGPVGLSAAIELRGRGVDVAVVDKATGATLVRAGAMGHSPRVVEHFRRWGLLQAIRDEWTFPPEWNRGIRLVTSLAGHDLGPDPAYRRQGGPSSEEALRRPQSALQKVFLTRLAELGVPVGGGWELRALDERADGVEAVLAQVATGERHLVRARYVIGADGNRSSVRTLSGIERDGDRATEKRYRLIVRTGDIRDRVGPAPSGVNIVFNERSSGFLAAVSHRDWRVYAGPYPLDHEPTESELIGTAAASFGFDLDLELISATVYYDASRIAQTFRKGRVLLAGDAAHVRTPGGNLGEGFGDVVNLGWKLAAVLHGSAPDTLLESYDEERRRHNWRVADHALERSRRSRAVLAELRAEGIPADSDGSAGALERRERIRARLATETVAAPGVTFDERYDQSRAIWYENDGKERVWAPDVYEDDPRPGHRAPNGAVDTYGGTLHDRIGAGFSLLSLGDDRSLEASFEDAARRRGVPLAVVHLGSVPAGETYRDAAYFLVRPDQHVAWRGDDLPEGGADAVLDRVLGAG
ncbi:FAD-dependent oxidoreductase [Kineosporia succinea]|uniref:2-polyprenyl-6-methoxyphenol hydroxylase-like FAD-dependent oxidoreductase n=1 Tax=Kineosporia succinea TaxID=84632 RepID=A0ABT9P8U7_9ACTN|nr:FAD-dependent oxidoreductase [Kineosporia succinea]MDP9829121.1 2-polyprenyl-6-methoxyphenol hydroxylase-like FAD-dependent oxidoreductase [Kineosporia succinea]